MTESDLRQKAGHVTEMYDEKLQRILREHNEKIAAIQFQERLRYGVVGICAVLCVVGPIVYHLLVK